MAKKELKQVYDDCWVYILLLTTLAILIQSLKNYTFTIVSYKISYNILLIPVSLFLTNYILKKFDYKKAIAGIAISAVISVSFIAMIYFGLGRRLIISNICGDFFAYVVSQYVNLFIYEFLYSNSKNSYLLTFLTYMFSTIIYIMVYTLIYLNSIVMVGYWMRYLTTLIIELVLCLTISYFDTKIKKD